MSSHDLSNQFDEKKGRKMSKFYWSSEPAIGVKDTSGVMTYILFPRKWWSIKDWKLAWSFRNNFYVTAIVRYKSNDPKE